MSFKPNATLVIFLILVSKICFTQNVIEGYIFDKTNEKPLAYAAIILGNSGLYTTSNEDGKFQIQLNKSVDSLEVRYLGYEIKKIPIDYFRLNKILYLAQYSTVLNEVVLNTGNKGHKFLKNQTEIVEKPKKKDSYETLFKIIKKYRKNKRISESKAYFNLNSKSYSTVNSISDTIPLELIEGLYNSKQQLSKGLFDLELKTGRFGQNKTFPFYSLHNILFFKHLKLFKKGNQLLPSHPGNISLNKLKRKYLLEQIKRKSYNGDIISFKPKNEKDGFFSGNFFYKKDDLTLEKIEFFIKNPKHLILSPIVKKDSVSIKNLSLNILFNPIDLNKIQYYDLELDLEYYSDNVKQNIISKPNLYLYDYNIGFTRPHFSNKINFKNDYDRVLALPISDKIWEQYYPYPKSKKNLELIDFFQEKNQSYNYYKNQIPLHALEHVKRSSIVWKSKKELLSKDIKEGPGVNLNFSYALNSFVNNDGGLNFSIKTLFDTQTSFFHPKRSPKELSCINLAFDIYELNRHYLLDKIKKSISHDAIEDLSIKASLDAKVMVNLMLEECLLEVTDYNLNQWKNKIQNELKKYKSF